MRLIGKRTGTLSARFASAAILGAAGMVAAAAPAAAASPSESTTVALPGCVRNLGFSEDSKGNHLVTVANDCGSKKCYRVDVPWQVDGRFSVAAYATETDMYGSRNSGRGVGIYEDNC